MSLHDIISKLELLWLNEDVRLSNRIAHLERVIIQSGFNQALLIDYIGAVANREYFKRFIGEVLDYLRHFE